MKFSREQYIFAASAFALVLALGIGVYSYMHRDPYAGLVTHMDVQVDEGIKTLVTQRISTTQAAIQAAKDAGQKVELDLYAAIASDALILGDLVTARESLEAYIAENSLDSATWTSYGYTLFSMGDFEGAKTAYMRAVELSPSEQTYRSALRLLEQKFPDDRQEMKRLYDDSIDTLGQKMFNMLGLAHWYTDGGDCDRAKDHFDVAKSLAADNDERQKVVDEANTAIAACKELAGTATSGEGKELRGSAE